MYELGEMMREVGTLLEVDYFSLGPSSPILPSTDVKLLWSSKVLQSKGDRAWNTAISERSPGTCSVLVPFA